MEPLSGGVSAIIVTRGNVPLEPILEPIPAEWEKIVWWNDPHNVPVSTDDVQYVSSTQNLSVLGRYAAIDFARHDVIYVQDDDVIVSDPSAIVAPLLDAMYRGFGPGNGVAPFLVGLPVVCNMPPEFRHDFYSDNALVGFGAAFHRDAPERAFNRFTLSNRRDDSIDVGFFDRTCDIVFTGLCEDSTGAHRLLVDVPYESLEYATGPDRMYRQPTHVAERMRMRELVREVARGR